MHSIDFYGKVQCEFPVAKWTHLPSDSVYRAFCNIDFHLRLSTVLEYGDVCVCVCVPNILRIHREEKGREREGELMLFDLFLVLTTYK